MNIRKLIQGSSAGLLVLFFGTTQTISAQAQFAPFNSIYGHGTQFSDETAGQTEDQTPPGSQDFGQGGQPPPGGPGFGPGGQGFGPGGPPPQGPMQSMRAVDAPVEALADGLHLTGAQRDSIRQIQQDFRSKQREFAPRPQQPLDPETMQANREKMRGLADRYNAQIIGKLTEDQKKDLPNLLKELDSARMSGIPLEVYGAIKLTGEQKNNIAELATKSQQDIQKRQMAARQNGEPPIRREEMQQLTQKLHAKVMAILSETQKALVEQFVRDHPRRGQGGFGPPPGGDGFGPPPGQDGGFGPPLGGRGFGHPPNGQGPPNGDGPPQGGPGFGNPGNGGQGQGYGPPPGGGDGFGPPQGGGNGFGPPRGGPGQGGPGQPGFGGPGGRMDQGELLTIQVPVNALTSILNLTDSQQEQVEKLVQNMHDSNRPPGPPPGGAGGGNPGYPSPGQQFGPRPNMQQQRARLTTASAELEKLLTDAQRKKLPVTLKALQSLRDSGTPLQIVDKLKLSQKQMQELAKISTGSDQGRRNRLEIRAKVEKLFSKEQIEWVEPYWADTPSGSPGGR